MSYLLVSIFNSFHSNFKILSFFFSELIGFFCKRTKFNNTVQVCNYVDDKKFKAGRPNLFFLAYWLIAIIMQ